MTKINKVELTQKLQWVILCKRQNNNIQSAHVHTLHLVTVWMDRVINNIVGSMVLSLTENIVCHFRMLLYSLRVITRFLREKKYFGRMDGRTEWHRHFLSCVLCDIALSSIYKYAQSPMVYTIRLWTWLHNAHLFPSSFFHQLLREGRGSWGQGIGAKNIVIISFCGG